MTKFRAGTSGKIIPAATSTRDGYATAAQIAKLDGIEQLTMNSIPVDGIQLPMETITFSGGVAVSHARCQRDTRTELDNLVLGNQGSSNFTRRLLSEATVMCPLFGRDRYWDSSDSTWRSRNYGKLGGGLILGNSTQANSQLPYTSGQKGCRLLVAGGVGAMRIPYAWLAPDSEFTVLIRYQRPAGVTNFYSSFFQIGDVGGISGTGRVWMRTLETDIFQVSNGGILTFPASAYNPKVICVTAAAGAAGEVKFYCDGYLQSTGVKQSGTLSGADHLIGGVWIGGVVNAYAHWNILDVIIIPRKLTTDEIPWLTRAVQYPHTPSVDLLSGQSNMFGPGKLSNGEPCVLPSPLPNASVAFVDESYNSNWHTGFGPCELKDGDEFGPEISICAARPNRYVIKYACNGLGSTGWIGVSGISLDIADSLMAPFAELSCCPVVENFVFRQGETDAETDPATMTPALRKSRLDSIVGQLRAGFNQPPATLRAVIARVPAAIATYPTILSLDNVRAGDALFVASDSNAVLVDIDSCAVRPNNLHNTNQGVLDVGTLCAAQMKL